MMKIITSAVSLALMAASFQTFADKIVITGEPVILEQQGSVYTLPKDYTTTESYYYVSMNGTKSVCYLEKQTTLTSLNATVVSVNVNGQPVQWNCYPVDETYFQVTP